MLTGAQDAPVSHRRGMGPPGPEGLGEEWDG